MLKKAKAMSNLKSPFLRLVPGAAAWHLPAKAKLRFNVTKDQSSPAPKTKKKKSFLLENLAAVVTVTVVSIATVFKQ